MRLRTVCKGIVMGLMTTATLQANGQAVEVNGTQVVAIGGGGELINNSVSKQTTAMTKTALLESAIGAEYASIKSWESKYNSYLKTASGYAEGLKAATTLYAEGVITLRHLYEIIHAVGNNPQGVVATMSMNNLYAETASELIKVYAGHRRQGKHADRRGAHGNTLAGKRHYEGLQLQASQAGPEHFLLYADRCLEQGNGRNDRARPRRDST